MRKSLGPYLSDSHIFPCWNPLTLYWGLVASEFPDRKFGDKKPSGIQFPQQQKVVTDLRDIHFQQAKKGVSAFTCLYLLFLLGCRAVCFIKGSLAKLLIYLRLKVHM